MRSGVLDEGDAVAVLEVVEQLADASTLDEYAEVAMSGLTEMIDCIDASYNEMNPNAGRIRWRSWPENARMEEFTELFGALMRQNPLVRHFEETDDTRTMMWSDLAPLDEIRRTKLYQEMFRPLGVDSQMALVLPAPPGIVVGFAVNTGPEGFSERDRLIMNTLRPHLAHTYRTIHLRDEFERARQALESAGWAAALADRAGTVLAVTDNSPELESTTGVSIRKGEPLPCRLAEAFESGIAAYDASQPAVRSRATRLSDDGGGVDGWHVPGPVGPHVVMVHSGADKSRRRLEDAGLSPREVDVALHLAEGGTNAAVAARLGIAEGTVRKHLERIYRRLDVTDRGSAIVRIRGW